MSGEEEELLSEAIDSGRRVMGAAARLAAGLPESTLDATTALLRDMLVEVGGKMMGIRLEDPVAVFALGMCLGRSDARDPAVMSAAAVYITTRGRQT